MNSFTQISQALKYIDTHLDEQIYLEKLSEQFFFSPFYFHRLFSAIVGKSLAAYIRDRRILFACKYLCETQKPVSQIASFCGFKSPQAFSRTFKKVIGFSPIEYRNAGYQPIIESADELIMKFTNRLQGGVFLNPNIIQHGKLIIAGTYGDGNNTGEVWQNFMQMIDEKPLNSLSGDSYEIRVYDGDICTVYVGVAIPNRDDVDSAYTVFELPASKYASFDVYPVQGYESENSAINEWLQTNEKGYSQRLINEKSYCVEYYDERFNGNETDSIVEIWIPIEKS